MTRLKEPKADGEILFAEDLNDILSNYVDTKMYNLAVTDTSASLDISGVANRQAILIRNSGYVDCFITFGATATTNALFLEEGSEVLLKNVCFDNVSAITESGSTTLSISVFVGNYEGKKTNFEILKLNVTDTSTSVSFSSPDNKDVLVVNSSYNDAYLSLTNTATANDFLITGRNYFSTTAGVNNISGIASNTAVFSILGVY